MIAIVLAFLTNSRNSEVECLYAGTDGAEARRIMDSPPEGVVRTELLVNPQYTRRKLFGAVAVAADEVVAPVGQDPASQDGAAGSAVVVPDGTEVTGPSEETPTAGENLTLVDEPVKPGSGKGAGGSGGKK